MMASVGDLGQTGRRADSQQLVRQWALLRLLADSGRAFGVKELSEQLGVSKATVQRDLATLERDFALVEESAGKQKKTYRIDQKVKALEERLEWSPACFHLAGEIVASHLLQAVPQFRQLLGAGLPLRLALLP